MRPSWPALLSVALLLPACGKNAEPILEEVVGALNPVNFSQLRSAYAGRFYFDQYLTML